MTHNTFTVINIKTAAGDPEAISQVGLVKYIDSKLVWKYTTRVDPSDADGARPFQEKAPAIFKFLDGEIVVGYGPLARSAIEAAFQEADLDCPQAQWVDCQQVIRRTWPKFSGGGDELEKVCEMIRYRFIPGEALQDAQAAGIVFLAAIKESGYTAEAWCLFIEEGLISRKGK
jgi:DNA polymerase III subunit epsilon